MFDFAVQHAPGSDGIEFALVADADPVSTEWFPHLHRGVLLGLDSAREHGRAWVRTRVEVRKVHTHPTDTTAHGCERYGFCFALHELPHRGVRLPPIQDAEPSEVVPD